MPGGAQKLCRSRGIGSGLGGMSKSSPIRRDQRGLVGDWQYREKAKQASPRDASDGEDEAEETGRWALDGAESLYQLEHVWLRVKELTS